VGDEDEGDEEDEEVEGVNVIVGPLLGAVKTILLLESVAVIPNGLVNKLGLLDDCVNIMVGDPVDWLESFKVIICVPFELVDIVAVSPLGPV